MILQSAFANAFDSGSSTALFKIPSSVVEIAQYSFNNIRGAIAAIQIGEKEKGSHLRIIMTGDLMTDTMSVQDSVISFSNGLTPSELDFWAKETAQQQNFTKWLKRGDATIVALAAIPTISVGLADDHIA